MVDGDDELTRCWKMLRELTARGTSKATHTNLNLTRRSFVSIFGIILDVFQTEFRRMRSANYCKIRLHLCNLQTPSNRWSIRVQRGWLIVRGIFQITCQTGNPRFRVTRKCKLCWTRKLRGESQIVGAPSVKWASCYALNCIVQLNKINFYLKCLPICRKTYTLRFLLFDNRRHVLVSKN